MERQSYQVFCQRVLAWTRPLQIGVRFNAANGRYYANLSNGDTIIGNANAKSLAYRTFNGREYRLPEAV